MRYEYQIETNGYATNQMLYIIDGYVLQSINSNDFLFKCCTGKLYSIELIQNKLKEVNQELYRDQLASLKSSIGTLCYDNYEGDNVRRITVFNSKGSSIKFHASIEIKNDSLVPNEYTSFHRYQIENQLFDCKLVENELITSVKSMLEVNQNVQSTHIKLINVDQKDDLNLNSKI